MSVSLPCRNLWNKIKDESITFQLPNKSLKDKAVILAAKSVIDINDKGVANINIGRDVKIFCDKNLSGKILGWFNISLPQTACKGLNKFLEKKVSQELNRKIVEKCPDIIEACMPTICDNNDASFDLSCEDIKAIVIIVLQEDSVMEKIQEAIPLNIDIRGKDPCQILTTLSSLGGDVKSWIVPIIAEAVQETGIVIPPEKYGQILDCYCPGAFPGAKMDCESVNIIVKMLLENEQIISELNKVLPFGLDIKKQDPCQMLGLMYALRMDLKNVVAAKIADEIKKNTDLDVSSDKVLDMIDCYCPEAKNTEMDCGKINEIVELILSDADIVNDINSILPLNIDIRDKNPCQILMFLGSLDLDAKEIVVPMISTKLEELDVNIPADRISAALDCYCPGIMKGAEMDCKFAKELVEKILSDEEVIGSINGAIKNIGIVVDIRDKSPCSLLRIVISLGIDVDKILVPLIVDEIKKSQGLEISPDKIRKALSCYCPANKNDPLVCSDLRYIINALLKDEKIVAEINKSLPFDIKGKSPCSILNNLASLGLNPVKVLRPILEPKLKELGFQITEARLGEIIACLCPVGVSVILVVLSVLLLIIFAAILLIFKVTPLATTGYIFLTMLVLLTISVLIINHFAQ